MAAVSLGDEGRRLADERTFVVVGTVGADGRPHLNVAWVTRDADTLLLSTVEGRLWQRNMAHNPDVSVLLPNAENPYAYVEVRGSVEMTPEGGRELIDALAHKYRGHDYPVEPEGTVRLVVRVTPRRVVVRG